MAHRRWDLSTFLVILAFLVVAGMASFSAWATLSLASETHGALCALRGDLEQRVAGSKAYLKDHPHGAPGIPAKLIRDGLRNQERTIAALHRLNCDAP